MGGISTVAELIAVLAERFQSRSDTARLDAQILVAHAAGRDRTWALAHPEACLTGEQRSLLRKKVEAVDSGMPLPYVLGKWEFYDMTFDVNPAVLIPRPETEHLVDTAIDWLRRRMHAGADQLRAVDVGTGSGCIAVSIAAHTPKMAWTACDVSRPALHLARQNAQYHHVQDRISFVETDLLAGFASGSFDLVCANLPYIPTAVLAELPVFEREPTLALDGGPDGLDLVRQLLAQAQSRLSPGGLILAEVESAQGSLTRAAAETAFPHAHVEIKKDYAGHDRLLVIRLPQERKRHAV